MSAEVAPGEGGLRTDRRPTAPVLELHGVVKRYPGGVEALRGVDLTVQTGELCAILGPSGSGKSTLLHIMGTLERATSGVVRIAGADVSSASDRELAALRARRIGFVFQQFHLLEAQSALENVAGGLLTRHTGPRAAPPGSPRLGTCRARPSHRPHLGVAVRRRAPARGDRPRARQRAGDRARR